ncbi:hypothetical protein M409DRAFT_15878 [Zasmidium cellare ATCC 36951]|uniref:FAD-binding domain-containing protein n=1 Tax=Zasmidium cellare ATCC 36951 TaxID=1080233 RepID=A0A6A6D625_ZASCE|nr:uncharacterized protein M409DRAFT_15878 [Zasmidium cellare ATCC 36951]KAF2173599.1 hypothetical protein M409DRAFT_15878 [Zasmidium cellare ATCC 36951]
MGSLDVQRDPPTGISVLISGAGVGGLTSALEFWRKGCDVRVLERAKESLTTGDTFQIGPSVRHMFKHYPELQRRHDEVDYNPLFCKSKHTGERMMKPVPFASITTPDKNGYRPSSSTHSRPKFHKILLEQMERLGIEIEFGKEVVDYYEGVKSAKAGVVLKDGSKEEADLVIAADGLRGKSWSLVAGEPVPVRSSGSAVFRAAYPVELAIKDPEVAARFPLEEDGTSIFELWLGPGMFATFWRNDESMMWSITHPDEGTAEESWNHKVSPQTAVDYTATVPGWPEVANKVILATPPDVLIDWKLMWRDPQPSWVSPGGYVVQLGDAAHTFLPSSGNGATQAIEDSASLAACVAIAGKENIPDAARVHNLLRFERVSFLQAMGVARRDARTSKNGKKEEPLMPGMWLWGHDPEAYAEENFEKALAHIKDGAPFKSTNKPANIEYRPWTIDSLSEALEKGEPSILEGDWS